MSFIPQAEFMLRAIELAKLGGGHVHPNPLVGAVIVRHDRVIAEGYHHKCGDLHAERDAFKNAREAGVDVSGAVMYVTLEPCCHTGRQPPCTQAVIESGIKTVVIGSRDPNELVNGKGVAQLEEAGITVIRDFMREECDAINGIFFHYIQTKKPYVIVKYAMTADGKTSLSTGESKWITGEEARANVHRTRGTVSAVMCGINTVLADDPMLNCRVEGDLYAQPVRVVLDRNLQLPPESNLAKTAAQLPVLVFYSRKLDGDQNLNGSPLKKMEGIELVPVAEKDGHLDLEEVLDVLGQRKIDSVLVESGGGLNSSIFFGSQDCRCLASEVHCYVAPKIAGGVDEKIHSPVQGLECMGLSQCVRMGRPQVEFFCDDILLKFKVEPAGARLHGGS